MKAFTLIELLIVLVILGIGFMSFTPVIFDNVIEPNKLVAFFNETLEKYTDEANKKGEPIVLKGSKSQATLTKVTEKKLNSNSNNEEIDIPTPSTITSVEINDELSYKDTFYINIYPNGICDHFIINFSDHASIESIPLIMEVVEKSNKN
ncbi:MAG: type II secretion system protein [Deferribacterota bacterium]|nr:type II secretion system protein [Deferribacterota bacterium]